MTQPPFPERPPTNRAAIWALVATGLLLFPVGAVLAVVALVQILRSRPRQDGLVLALLALITSGLLVPGILVVATLGTPRAMDGCYYTQESAVGILRLIAYLEEKHHDEHGRYGSLEEIGFRPKVSVKPYAYRVERYDEGRYLATARGEGPMEGDLLAIDETRQVRRVMDVCKR